MSEFKKTMAIFKARWHEVAFIIISSTIITNLKILLRLFQKYHIYSTVVYLLFTTFLMIAIIIIRYGFLRTVFIDGRIRRSLTELLKTGSRFFWRMFAFGLFFMLIYLALLLLFSFPLSPFLSRGTNLLQKRFLYPMFFSIQSNIILLILIKLTLFVPALIIVLDCGLIKSFNLLKRCKLAQAIEPVLLYSFTLLMNILFSALSISLKHEHFVLNSCLQIFHSALGYFLNLAVVVMAVRYVASLWFADRDEQPHEDLLI